MQWLAWMAAGVIGATAPGWCVAAHPLATEEADILERSDCEWEGTYERHTAHRAPSENGWATQLSCGIGVFTQLALAYGEAHSGGLRSHGATLLGKTGLLERTDNRIGLALAWSLGGVKDSHQDFKHEHTQIYFAATQEVITDLIWHANLGWMRHHTEHRNVLTWNVAGEYAVGHRIALVGEFYGEGHSKPWWGVGTRWQATQSLILSTGFSLQAEKPRVRLWSVGFTYTF